MEEKEIIFNSAKSLFEIGKNLEHIDNRLSEFALFLSDRVLSIGESRGYNLKDSKKSECTEDCQICSEDAPVIEDQAPTMNCNGHSNIPTPKVDRDVQSDVADLVKKIRSETKDAR